MRSHARQLRDEVSIYFFFSPETIAMELLFLLHIKCVTLESSSCCTENTKTEEVMNKLSLTVHAT